MHKLSEAPVLGPPAADAMLVHPLQAPSMRDRVSSDV
jgi:hypothetical protein